MPRSLSLADCSAFSGRSNHPCVDATLNTTRVTACSRIVRAMLRVIAITTDARVYASAFRRAIMLGSSPLFRSSGDPPIRRRDTRVSGFCGILRCTISTSPLQTAAAPGRVNVTVTPGEREAPTARVAPTALPHSQRPNVSD